MGRRILDHTIMSKLAKKLNGRPLAAINVMVSRKAAKLSISSEAALVLLAKEHGIGTSTYQRKLDPAKQAEIRTSIPAIFVPNVRAAAAAKKGGSKAQRPIVNGKAALKSAIGYLIQDAELLGRCADILMAPRNFDRPINQATLVLEERIRTKSLPPRRMVGETLVNYAFKEDMAQTVLQVSSNDPDDQRGFTQLLRGLVGAFRNKTHHHVTTSFSREDAIRVCGFIDVLLRVVDNSAKVR